MTDVCYTFLMKCIFFIIFNVAYRGNSMIYAIIISNIITFATLDYFSDEGKHIYY